MTSHSFDAIVVGSGFGGAVSACRMAQAGLRVLILERGRRYPMGSFPRDLRDKSRWLYSECEQGIIDIKPLVTEMVALQVAGYGGGSLLYNNVQMRPPAKLFASGWPQDYKRESLDPYYDLVGYMLDIKPISAAQPLGLPQRTKSFRQAAEALGRDAQFFLPNLAVDFSTPDVSHKNKFGVEQKGCTHCGECIVGCNRHAKNTLDLNYLAIAERSGAEVRTRCQVQKIQTEEGGYTVTYKDLATGCQEVQVTARSVFVCAGAINSTELLLNCRDTYGTLRKLGDKLGTGYSANGDFLALGYRTREPLGPTRGPGITSAILYDRSAGKQQTWFLLEDGGVSEDLARHGQMMDPQQTPLGTGRMLWRDAQQALNLQLDADPPEKDIDHSAMLLLMGRDSASGRLSIDSTTGVLRMSWDLESNLPLYQEQARLAADFVKELGGEVVYNPMWKQLHQPITIHNLGGCPMADCAEAGVTDANGEVFGHPGLFVLDGARLPVATGVNPSHTIAATAERSIEHYIRRVINNPHWQAPERACAHPIEEPFDKVVVPVGGTHEPLHHLVGMNFHETMCGFVTQDFSKQDFSKPDAYVAAARAGKACDQRMDFTLKITAPDLDAFLIERDHTAMATGVVHVHGFTGKDGAPVSAGIFNLFVETGAANARKMLYAMPFYGQDGKPYLLDGWKDIRDHGTLDVWESTTTLYTAIREGHTRDGAVRALGTLLIDLPAVLKLLASIHITGTHSATEKAVAIERLGSSFFGTLWKVYIKPRLTLPSILLGGSH